MKGRGWRTRALRVLPLALAALAAAGCESDPYLEILPAPPPYPVMQRGDSAQLVGAYIRDVVFLSTSFAHYLYDSQQWPESFTWTSSDLSVATVDADGVVRAVGEGVAEIHVSGYGLRSRPDSVTVLRAP